MFRSDSIHHCCTERREPFLIATKKYDMLDVIPTIDDSHMKTEMRGSGMEGSGFADRVNEVMEGSGFIDTVKSAVKGVDNLLFGDVGTTVSNIAHKALNKNPDWRSGFSGEKHALLQTPQGLTRANYMGPGTQVAKRIDRGDKGIAPVDEISRIHDLRYSISENENDVRRADNLMVQAVDRSNDTKFNKALAKNVIKAKMKAEDWGIAKTSNFTTFGGITDPARKAKYKQLISQSGLGFNTLPHSTSGSQVDILPAEIIPNSGNPSLRLKKKLLKNIHKKR